MYRKQAIEDLRNYLREQDCSAIIIPSNDPHFGEYIPDHYKSRAWISGFDGSAGTVVITLDKAALWTDSRYFIAAASALEGSSIELMKMGIDGTPTISQWLKSVLDEDSIVAIDEDLFTYSEYQKLVDELSPCTVTMVEDPFSSIWKDRPLLEFNDIMLLDEKYAGESVSSKLERFRETLDYPLPYAYIITELDETAWLFNIRGRDIEYNPVVLSYAVILPEKAVLFLRQDRLPDKAMSYLNSQGVEVEDYEQFTSYLRSLPKNHIRIFSRNRITARNYFAALENVYETPQFSSVQPDPVEGGTINMMKARKNPVELEGFRKAYEQDGIAWRKLLDYISENKDKGITEYQVALKLIEFRSECPDYMGESFAPIVAYASNAAIVHYEPSESCSSVIEPKGMLLIDTGAHYLYGTTDTTRTIPLGELTQEEKDDYTLVLKGMVDLSMARFLKGTRGAQLDILARGPVMTRVKVYLHGTGHGIGHFLNVHEGPQSIRKEDNPVPLMPGMVMSNEPGVYVEGRYGIRHENTIVVREFVKTDMAEFYQFETLTKVPFDLSVVNRRMLSDEEMDWLEAFNSSSF